MILVNSHAVNDRGGSLRGLLEHPIRLEERKWLIYLKPEDKVLFRKDRGQMIPLTVAKVSFEGWFPSSQVKCRMIVAKIVAHGQLGVIELVVPEVPQKMTCLLSGVTKIATDEEELWCASEGEVHQTLILALLELKLLPGNVRTQHGGILIAASRQKFAVAESMALDIQRYDPVSESFRL
jgi:hypothetical protein